MNGIIKIGKNPVIVEWMDACDRGRVTLQTAISRGLSPGESLGYLVYEDEEKLLLCYFYDNDLISGECHDFTVIPKCCVKKIINLKIREEKETEKEKE